MSIRPRTVKRDIHGILLVNKPLGLSSNRALQRVKGMLSAKKAGHTGALDPLATGMLPICLGDATRFSQWLLNTDKSYEVEARLGVRTTTSDAEGEVVSTRDVPALSHCEIESVLSTFRGNIMQVPSMYSALKHQGKPLYEYARAGIEVERPARPLTIHALTLESFSGDTLRLTVSCSKGTYIRSLVDDIGETIGCGAHVTVLHRSRVGLFESASMQTLEDMQACVDANQREQLDARILPLSVCVAQLPSVQVSDLAATKLRQGQRIDMPSTLPLDTEVAIGTLAGEFVGVGVIMPSGQLAPRRLRAVV